MTGGAGDDVLNGGVGSDTYVCSKGDGADTIFDRSGQSAQTDTLSLADVASTGVTLTRHRGDLLLTVNATGETITVANQFLAPAFRGGLESIRFSDGVSWTFDDILAHTIVHGSAASETLAGTAFADTINGLAGDDTINGYAGDDRLTGGAGNDVLIGGAVAAAPARTLMSGEKAMAPTRSSKGSAGGRRPILCRSPMSLRPESP